MIGDNFSYGLTRPDAVLRETFKTGITIGFNFFGSWSLVSSTIRKLRRDPLDLLVTVSTSKLEPFLNLRLISVWDSFFFSISFSSKGQILKIWPIFSRAISHLYLL